MKVNVNRELKTIPTYIPGKPIELPMFFEHKPYQGASGRLYPLPYSDSIGDEKQGVDYDIITLENEYIKTQNFLKNLVKIHCNATRKLQYIKQRFQKYRFSVLWRSENSLSSVKQSRFLTKWYQLLTILSLILTYDKIKADIYSL